MIAVITSVLITGTLLAPIQSYASSNNNNPRSPGDTTNDGGFFDSRSLKQATHDEIHADLKNNNQSINQENVCFRSNTCKQSEVGQNTLGNDNQVTGFTDQSDNIPQAVAPTSAVGAVIGFGDGTLVCSDHTSHSAKIFFVARTQERSKPAFGNFEISTSRSNITSGDLDSNSIIITLESYSLHGHTVPSGSFSNACGGKQDSLDISIQGLCGSTVTIHTSGRNGTEIGTFNGSAQCVTR
jgi:hypothetical protein